MAKGRLGASRTFKQAVARRIRHMQAMQEYSVSDMASRLNVPRTTVTEWLSGRVLPRAEHLRSLSQHFGYSVDWILDCERDRPCEECAKREIAELDALLGSLRTDS